MEGKKSGAKLPEDGGVCPKCKVTPRRSASVMCGYISLACLVGFFVLGNLPIPFLGFVLLFLIIFIHFCIYLIMPVALLSDLIRVIRRRVSPTVKGLDLIYALFLWIVSFVANDYLYENILIEGTSKHSSVARTRGDQRSMTIALETYALDLKRYPAWSLKNEENAFGGLRDKKGALARIPTFRTGNGTALATLTTPVGYLSSYWIDPFAPIKGATFGYWHDDSSNTTATGFIIWSPGPDGVYDLTIDNIAQAYSPEARDSGISNLLVNCTYDPSNGTTSRGDIYRTKM